MAQILNLIMMIGLDPMLAQQMARPINLKTIFAKILMLRVMETLSYLAGATMSGLKSCLNQLVVHPSPHECSVCQKP